MICVKKALIIYLLFFSLTLYAKEMQIKKLSDIETLMSGLGSSLSSLASKQEENLQKLGEHWMYFSVLYPQL